MLIGPGSVLAGRYRIEDLLEEAAGAKFWRATDQILARSVAVHVIASSDPRAASLLAAARTSATVTDSHFLRVLDAAQENGMVYVVNEWGSGMSLDKILADGPLPPRRAAWVVREVADAVSTAHRHGVAHGRLLPENVMVSEAGAVKLIGFVIDSVLHDSGAAEIGNGQDVLDLAALLYATLVGKWPGSAGSALPEAPREHGRALRPRQVRAGVPRPLDAICDRVLNAEAHPHAMPIETAQEIGAALSDFIGDPNGSSPLGYEPTVVLDGNELATKGLPTVDETDPEQRTADQPTTISPVEPPGTDPEPEPAPETEPEPEHPVDPEATQAGAPVFFDEGSGVGWMGPGQARGLRSDDPDNYRRPAPPPPLPEPEPRPLFAPDPPGGRVHRAQPPPAAAPRDLGARGTDPNYNTGHGTGSLPAVWGPDAESTGPDEEQAWEGGDSSKSWLQLAGIVALCLVLLVAIIIAFNLGRGGSDQPGNTAGKGTASAKPTTGKVLDIHAVKDFDPQGSPPEENPQLAPLAIDGNASTAWHSLTYQGSPELGNLKDGVGLRVDLGKPVDVSEVRLTLIGSGTSLQILAADPGAGAPTSIDGLKRVASATDAGSKVDLSFKKTVKTRYLVVWLTSLPPFNGGYQGQIAEIVARS